ncbi:MAG: rhomboid family intramembrane serine protease, partial [Phycisphaerae bacterium]|nr:rhomboid family intramembrane serine protease [Phycisphaerae bacterium]
LLFNMIGLYFLGPALERSWGTKRFLTFYLTCGLVGGLLFVITSALNLLGGGLLIGASGGVLGLLVACAILFPQFVVILLFFPVPIRFAAVLFTFVYLLSVLGGEGNAGGDLCHLGGMATGFIWVMGRPYFQSLLGKSTASAIDRKQLNDQELQYDIDRILAKVHQQGIQSLTRKEKQILQKATDQQRRG